MISRRLFLRNTAAAGAVGAAVAAPCVLATAAEPEMTPHELVSHYADQLAEALRMTNDTLAWRVDICHEHAFVLIVGRQPKGTRS